MQATPRFIDDHFSQIPAVSWFYKLEFECLPKMDLITITNNSSQKTSLPPHFFLFHPKKYPVLEDRTLRNSPGDCFSEGPGCRGGAKQPSLKSFQWKDLARGQVAGLVFLPKNSFLGKANSLPTNCHPLTDRIIPANQRFLDFPFLPIAPAQEEDSHDWTRISKINTT
jgi:hypothetical protein